MRYNFLELKYQCSFIPKLPSAKPSSQDDLTAAFNFVENLENGLKAAKKESKPVMLFAHWSRCGACASLISKLVESDEVKKLSRDCVMVNAYDMKDKLAEDVKYKPDGNYFPRYESFLSLSKKLLRLSHISLFIRKK